MVHGSHPQKINPAEFGQFTKKKLTLSIDAIWLRQYQELPQNWASMDSREGLREWNFPPKQY